MNFEKLAKRELEIMEILWESDKPLAASDIKENSDNDLSIYTIQNVLQKLLNKKYIEVADIVPQKKTFMRIYRPLITQTQYISDSINKKTYFELAFNFIKSSNDKDAIESLEKLIQEKMKKNL